MASASNESKKIKNEKKECPICTEHSTRNVDCLYCGFSACVECYKRVCIDSINKPCCMNHDCKKTFSDDFFMSVMPKGWFSKEYKEKVENDLFSFEKALLPETQPHVERLNRMESMIKEMGDVRDQIAVLNTRMSDLKLQYAFLKNGGALEDSSSVKGEVFVGACPVQDCRGFLSSRHKCGICATQACSDCREVKHGDDHKCNVDTVATVAEMKKTCRNCPNCMTAIYRISGCPQMWCTKCHVAFNWNTGKIEKGIVHNPHYFEYLRKNGGGEMPRNPHEVQCGGMPSPQRLRDRRLMVQIPVIKRFGESHKNSADYITSVYQQVVHLRQYVLPGFPTRMDNLNNVSIRIDYLRGAISEDQMKSKLYRTQKAQNKKLDERDILDMYCNVIQDLFYKLFDDFNVNEFIQNETRISEHVHEAYTTLNKKYKSTIRSLFSDDF